MATKASSAAGTFKRWGRRDPELYGMLAIVGGMFAWAGSHFARKNGTSETETEVVHPVHSAMPWEGDASDKSGKDFKYKYHPGGDTSREPKEAPGALTRKEVKVRNVDPEVLEKLSQK
ncbi:hypothetical protein SAICODRAFT_9753 [Saitoella complicata NRRL Y-17804]|nr:uncharacterized protein SAICODRAFT_9753 [Saitoella complicata NRRL Y-17804]ODQ50476.1 hypothetical protein SAICODRAFT_9753 [Saitoella complicata NRRL Y-17804]